MDFECSIAYVKNSLVVDSDEMRMIQACAAENQIVVCLGLSEKGGHSTHIGQCTIDSDGKLSMKRRKLKPFHLERTVFGDGNGKSLLNVSETSARRVGQLSCGVRCQGMWQQRAKLTSS
jgi:nitrilase